MKHYSHLNLKFFVLALSLVIFIPQAAHPYVAKYKEDYLKLYHVHYAQLPDDCMENIWWLEHAVKADFANPLYAYAKIENEDQWEKYRYLFEMHVNLKLIEQYLRLGRIYDKKCAYFYDAPWKEEYLRNLQKTKSCYEAAYTYWQEAQLWAEKANVTRFRFLTITALQDWEDERERISTGKLNYGSMLDRENARVQKVIDDLTAMKSKDY